MIIFKRSDYVFLAVLLTAIIGGFVAEYSCVVSKPPVVYQKTLADRYAEQSIAVVKIISVEKGMGTGFFIDDYTVVTANHVVGNDEKVIIKLKGNPLDYIGTVVKVSEETDLAIITVETPFRNQYLELTEKRQQVGESVYVIGHPLGLNWSISSGIISHLNRKTIERKLGKFIQIDAPVSSGSSGGPVFNANGKVIGIISYHAKGWDGLGIAVPVEFLRLLL